LLEQIPCDLHGGRVLPALLGLGIEPDVMRPRARESLQPHGARLLVPVLDAPAGLHDLVRAHAGVADQDELVIASIGAHHLQRGDLLDVAPSIVLPEALINDVVEVKILQMFDLAASPTKQRLTGAHVIVQRAADVQKQQHLDGVAPLGNEFEIQHPGVARGGVYGVVQIQVLGGAFAGELAELAQRDLDVAGAELDGVVEIAELALVPDLDRTPMPGAVLTDAYAFRVVAVRPERRDASRADPFGAAFMALLLLLQTLLQRFDELVPTAQRLDLRLLLRREIALGHAAQPLLWDARHHALEQLFGAFEMGGEGPVETVEPALVLHERRTRQIVEVFGAGVRELRLKRLEQRQELGDRDRHAGLAQLEKEWNQHKSEKRIAMADSAETQRRLRLLTTFRLSAIRFKTSLPLSSVQENELLEQMHILLVLEQRAIKRRDRLP